MNNIFAPHAEIKEKLSNIHYDLLGIIINQRTFTYWSNLISTGVSNIDDFVNNIIVSEEYINHILNIFKEEFNAVLGSNYHEIVVIDIVNNFKKKAHNIVFDEKRPIDVNQDIKKYISNLDCFSDKYKTFIKNEYVNKNGNITSEIEEIVDFYFDIFKEDASFDTTKLIEQIFDKKHLQLYNVESVSDGMEKHSFEEYHTKESTELKESNVMNHYLEIDKDSISSFYKIYKRQIFIEEYFHYVVNKKDNFKNAYEDYVKYFNIIKKIYLEYKNKEVTEYDYTISFIHHKEQNILETEFSNNVIDGIIAMDEYPKEMKSIIKIKYKFLYVEEIEDIDIEYYYHRIKTRKLSLNDENIEQVIVEYKKETDGFIHNIFEIYSKMLGRTPDINEINENLYLFRYSKSDEDYILAGIENTMIESLEFNEILKKQIQINYLTTYNKEILPSYLYNILKNIRSKIDNDKLTYKEILELIDSSIE